MYMNLKPNQHKRISLKTTTITSLGLIATNPPPPSPVKILGRLLNLAPHPSLIFGSGPPPQLFWYEIFSSHPKIVGGELLPW